MKPMSSRERIHAVINGLPCDRTPVTPIFMAWAAHFIGHTYRDYYLDGDVLVKSQLAVVREFGFDQVSAISDPWREASAYGMEFDYPEEGVGKPKGLLIKSQYDIDKLKKLVIEESPRMLQRVESVRKMANEIGRTHSVLGWVEGPLAEYSDLRGLEETLMELFDRPEMFEKAAERIVDNAINFAVAQIKAGADIIGVGDAACSLVGPELYKTRVLQFQKKLFSSIHDAGAKVKLHICGNISSIIEHMAASGADIIDVDWMVPLDEARRKVGEGITLCGNFDPSGVLLHGSPADVAAARRKCIQQGGKRFILMPGCEVPPGTPIENIKAFANQE